MIALSHRAARQIFAEVQRWVERGLRRGGAPLESMVYPLSHLVVRGEEPSPLELCGLERIQHLVIDRAAVPPDAIKAYSPTNCHFAPGEGDLRRANAAFNAELDALVKAQPRLAVQSKLHSHPFSARPFLSAGDLRSGVTSPAARRWRLRRGLDSAVLHIVYPSAPPRLSPTPWRITAEGARSRKDAGGVLWRVRSWGSRGDPEQMVDLGDAVVLPNRHPLVRHGRRKPYWTTLRGSRWCDAQKAALRGAGYQVSRNVMGRGWRRYLVRHPRRFLLVALPPDLPRQRPRVLQIHDAVGEVFEPLALPRAGRAARLSALDLTALVRHYLGPAAR